MEMTPGMKTAYMIVGSVLLAGIALFIYFYAPLMKPVAPQDDAISAEPDVSAEVSGALETPAEKLPETNPFSGYKNPFE